MKSKIILSICLALIVGLSVWLRIILPYDAVFGSGEVRFLTVDAYAHMRMADWCYQHFPNVMQYDAYLSYPDGAIIGARPLLSFIIASLAKGLGTSVDIIGAWLPAILGILLLVPVFTICWKLFNKWTAVIACAFVAAMPGELIGRTSLANTDHDALEILLMMLVLMFLILAIKKNWLFSIGAGICLGIYNLNWIGAPILTMILLTYLVIQSIISHYKKDNNNKLYYIMAITSTLGFLGYILPISFREFAWTYTILFTIAIALPLVVLLLTKLLSKTKWYYYPISLIALIVIELTTIWLVKPVFITMLIGAFVGTFIPQTSGLGTTISEMMPLLYYRGQFVFNPVWDYYGMCSILGIVGLVISAHKKWIEPSYLLFTVWCIFTIILTLLQRRYGYWAAVSLGILTGYIIWYICSALSTKQLNRQQKKRNESSINYSTAIISGLVILLLVFIPLLNSARITSLSTPYTITPAWLDGLHWLNNNTPKVIETDGQIPIGTNEYGTPLTNAAYNKVDGYGIVSWWDYGYWIAREGKRPVIVHPGGGWLLWTSQFLLCQEDDPYLKEYIERFKPRYVIIDYQMVTGKFYAIPEVAVSNLSSEISQRISKYTIDNMNRTLIKQLYYNNKFNKWELIWQSKQTYNKIPKVKIFEYKGT